MALTASERAELDRSDKGVRLASILFGVTAFVVGTFVGRNFDSAVLGTAAGLATFFALASYANTNTGRQIILGHE